MGLALGLDNFVKSLFPNGIDTTDQQLVNSFFAILLLLIFWLLATSGRPTDNIPFLPKLDSVQISIFVSIALFFLYLFFLELRMDQLRFIRSPVEDRQIWILLTAIAFLWMAGLAFDWSRMPFLVLLLGLVLYGVLVYLEIISIPWLYSSESNFIGAMEAIDRFFIGLDPYQIFDESTDGPFTQLPGFWLLFLPAWLLEFDPRWMNKIAFFYPFCWCL
ncbi:hypothetical protein KJ966_28380 [bacterium]|nr:hypothetical protein [bacterium]